MRRSRSSASLNDAQSAASIWRIVSSSPMLSRRLINNCRGADFLFAVAMKTKSQLFQILICSAVVFPICDVLSAKEPLYDGLGSYSRKITTDSAEAQRYFDQGLGFLHGFHHRAATRAFQQAAELDPKCAMAHWGVALACGPHINSMAVPPPAAELAWKELELAQKNAKNAAPVERALIDALAKRYANPQPEDRR